MATGTDVLNMLLPQGGWILAGESFDKITFIDDRPRCTEVEFQAGFAQYDAWKAQQDAKAATDKTALLAKLGLTVDELQTLLS